MKEARLPKYQTQEVLEKLWRWTKEPKDVLKDIVLGLKTSRISKS